MQDGAAGVPLRVARAEDAAVHDAAVQDAAVQDAAVVACVPPQLA